MNFTYLLTMVVYQKPTDISFSGEKTIFFVFLAGILIVLANIWALRSLSPLKLDLASIEHNCCKTNFSYNLRYF